MLGDTIICLAGNRQNAVKHTAPAVSTTNHLVSGRRRTPGSSYCQWRLRTEFYVSRLSASNLMPTWAFSPPFLGLRRFSFSAMHLV